MLNNDGRNSIMEKKHVTPEMTEEEEMEIVKRIQTGLDGLERISPVDTPDRQWFQDQVSRHQKLLRRRFIKDLLIFLSIASIVLSVSLAALARMPAVYLSLQAAALLAVPVIWTVNRRKRVNDQ